MTTLAELDQRMEKFEIEGCNADLADSWEQPTMCAFTGALLFSGPVQRHPELRSRERDELSVYVTPEHGLVTVFHVNGVHEGTPMVNLDAELMDLIRDYHREDAVMAVMNETFGGAEVLAAVASFIDWRWEQLKEFYADTFDKDGAGMTHHTVCETIDSAFKYVEALRILAETPLVVETGGA